MANFIWTGNVEAVAQVDTITITLDATPADNVFSITIGGFSVSVTGDTDLDTTCAALALAFNSSTHPFFEEVTAVSVGGGGGTITLTSDLAGRPFIATVSEVGPGSGTIGLSSTVANAGPNVFQAENFVDESGAVHSSLPSTSDSIYFENSEIDCLYNLDQSSQTVVNIYTSDSYEGLVGLPRNNESGDRTVVEYRPTHLTINVSGEVVIGNATGSGQGVQRFNLDLDDSTPTIKVLNTGSSQETGQPTVKIRNNGSGGSPLVVRNGDIGLAVGGGEDFTYTTVDQSGGSLYFGIGCTEGSNPDWEINGGRTIVDFAGTITQGTGDIIIDGGNVTFTKAVTVTGGEIFHRAGRLAFLDAATIDDLTLHAQLNLANGAGAVTFTNPPKVHAGAAIIDPKNRLAAAEFARQDSVNNISFSA